MNWHDRIYDWPNGLYSFSNLFFKNLVEIPIIPVWEAFSGWFVVRKVVDEVGSTANTVSAAYHHTYLVKKPFQIFVRNGDELISTDFLLGTFRDHLITSYFQLWPCHGGRTDSEGIRKRQHACLYFSINEQNTRSLLSTPHLSAHKSKAKSEGGRKILKISIQQEL